MFIAVNRAFWTILGYAFFTLAPVLIVRELTDSIIVSFVVGAIAFAVTYRLATRPDDT